MQYKLKTLQSLLVSISPNILVDTDNVSIDLVRSVQNVDTPELLRSTHMSNLKFVTWFDFSFRVCNYNTSFFLRSRNENNDTQVNVREKKSRRKCD